MNTLFLIQCRLGGKRLPNKCFLNFNSKTLIEWIYIRLKKLESIGKLVVAIPDNKENDILEKFLNSKEIKTFRGSENDVVDRFYKAAKFYKANVIIRICADNPFVCKNEITRLVDFYKHHNYDYCYNHRPFNNLYPDGLGAEICDIKILKKIYLNAKSNDREHIFSYLWRNKNLFKIGTFDPPKYLSYPNLKLDIDTLNDYWFLTKNKFNINNNTKFVINKILNEQTR